MLVTKFRTGQNFFFIELILSFLNWLRRLKYFQRFVYVYVYSRCAVAVPNKLSWEGHFMIVEIDRNFRNICNISDMLN